MTAAALAALSAFAMFEAFRIVLTADDLLRLRVMTRLALALATVCAPMGFMPFAALFLAVTAFRMRPDLRYMPIGPLLLLSLTPAVGVCAVYAALWGWALPEAQQSSWNQMAAWGPLCGLAILPPILPGLGFGWRFRYVSLAGAMVCGGAAAALATGHDAAAFFIALPSVIGGLVLAWRTPDTFALVRLSVGSATAVGAPLLIFAAQAGPWTQAPGDELLIVRAPLQGGGDGAYGVQTYSESGLSDGVTLVASGFQEMSRTRSRTGGMAGLRARLWSEDAWIVSAEATAGVDPFSLNTGSDDWERHAQADLTLMAGWSGEIDGAPVYASASLGWRIRPSAFGDAANASFSAGFDLSPSLQVNVHAAAEFNRDEVRPFGQASLVWRIDDAVALEAGVQSYSDRDGDAGAQAFAGLWLRF